MKKQLATICVGVALLAASAGQAWAGQPHHAKKGNACSMQAITHQIYKKLDLTAEQKTQLKDLRQEQRQVMQVNQDTRRADFLNFEKQREALLESTNLDVNAARALLEQQSQRQVEMRLKQWEWQHARWNVLTPTQKAEFKRLKAERVEQCASHMEIKAQRLLAEK